jgi:dTDP-4-dehydrorhamnose 3,5-epimerase
VQRDNDFESAGRDIVGWDTLLAKQSAVDSSGQLHTELIDGLKFRPTRPVPHEDGHLTEVARCDWDVIGEPIAQVHITTTFAGRVRAWGLHQFSTDRLFVVEGLVKLVVFDGRKTSPTFGRVNEFLVSDKNPALLLIPINVYHGWKNIGTRDATIINMPTRAYHHEAPDALDLPWDSEEATRIVPYKW